MGANTDLRIAPNLREDLGGLDAEELARLDGITAGTVTALKALVVDANKVIDTLGVTNLQVRVANKTGGTLAKGTLVYITGYDTTLALPTVTAADADTGGKGAQLVLPAAIETNAAGAAYLVGRVTGIDTSGASAVGSVAYASATAGEFAWAAPTGADQIAQEVGVCLTKHATTGSMVFYPGLRVIKAAGTSALQDDSVTPAKLDTASAGTVEASKAIVAGADKNLDTLAIADSGLKLGAGAGTAVTMTAAQINLLAQGVAGGYKVARGVETVTGTAAVATGLATVVAACASLGAAASMDAMFVSVGLNVTAGTLDLTVLKPTGTDNVTPTASSTATAIHWVAVGT
jgi:hypothetical protein